MQRCYRTFETISGTTYTVWVVARNIRRARELATQAGIPTSHVLTWDRAHNGARYRVGTIMRVKQAPVEL